MVEYDRQNPRREICQGHDDKDEEGETEAAPEGTASGEAAVSG